jgi:hypothetical protein
MGVAGGDVCGAGSAMTGEIRANAAASHNGLQVRQTPAGNLHTYL